MDKPLINKKLEFISAHLYALREYQGLSLEKLKDKPRDLKYVEKLIQELVDCAVDINQFILEDFISEKSWSSKQSFRDLENKILKKYKTGFGEKDLKLFIDTVSFRNEIVHSYDVNLYIIWAKRNIKTIVELYKKYTLKIIHFSKIPKIASK